MRIYDDEYYVNMTNEDLMKKMQRIGEYKNMNHENLQQTFKKHHRTPHLSIRDDGATLVNYGKKINIQSNIEKPILYIFARCPEDDHQLIHGDTRAEDLFITILKRLICNNIETMDILQFF